MAGPSYVNI